jgi:hypothetical protein
MKWQVESHAVDRFIQRVAPSLTYQQAEKILRTAFPERAIPIGRRSKHGDQQWEMIGYPAILITKRENRKTVIVTVVEKEEGRLMTEEEAEAMLRAYYEEHPEQAAKEAEIPEIPPSLPPLDPTAKTKQLQEWIHKLEAELADLKLRAHKESPKALQNRIKALESQVQGYNRSKMYLKTARVLLEKTQGWIRAKSLLSLCIQALIEYGDTKVIDRIRAEAPYFLTEEFLTQSPQNEDDHAPTLRSGNV